MLGRRFRSANVFFSELSIDPGENPGRTMLDDNLRKSDALVAVLTERAAQSAWVIWETAAVWGRQALLIPVFVDVHPSKLPGPIGQVAQGVKLNERQQLDRALVLLAEAVHAAEPEMLTDDEFEALTAAAVAGAPQVEGEAAHTQLHVAVEAKRAAYEKVLTNLGRLAPVLDHMSGNAPVPASTIGSARWRR